MSNSAITPEWFERVFREEIVPDVFPNDTPQEQPVVVLLGAQPGAGKTRAIEVAQQFHRDTLNVITGDDYRVLHPDYVGLQRHNPVAMPNTTQQVSGPMVERAITYAREHSLSALVEGTFRDPQVPLSTAQQFHDAGYAVHVLALAIAPAVSRMSAVARFYETLEQGTSRWTPLTAHEAALRSMPDTLEALGSSPLIDRLTIVNRNGRALMDSRTPNQERGADAAALLRTEHTRPLTPAEREDTRRTYLANARIAAQHPIGRSIAGEASVQAAWNHLAHDQEHLTPRSS